MSGPSFTQLSSIHSNHLPFPCPSSACPICLVKPQCCLNPTLCQHCTCPWVSYHGEEHNCADWSHLKFISTNSTNPWGLQWPFHTSLVHSLTYSLAIRYLSLSPQTSNISTSHLYHFSWWYYILLYWENWSIQKRTSTDLQSLLHAHICLLICCCPTC